MAVPYNHAVERAFRVLFLAIVGPSFVAGLAVGFLIGVFL